GIEPFETLSLKSQLKIIASWKTIPWDLLLENCINNPGQKPPKAIIYLLKKLRDIEGIEYVDNNGNKQTKKKLPHFRSIQQEHLTNIFFPEIGSTLSNLQAFLQRHPKRGNKSIIPFLLDAIGIKPFDTLSINTQLAILKYTGQIRWDLMLDPFMNGIKSKPPAIVIKVLELLRDIEGQSYKNLRGEPRIKEKLPHLWSLNENYFTKIYIPEIGPENGQTIKGLLDYFRRYMKKHGIKEKVIPFMLKSLGIKPFGKLPLKLQREIIKSWGDGIHWKMLLDDCVDNPDNKAPAVVKYLLNLLRDKEKLPHFWALRHGHFIDAIIPEIGQTLTGLYIYFYTHPKRGGYHPIELLLTSLKIKFPRELASAKEIISISRPIALDKKIGVREEPRIVNLVDPNQKTQDAFVIAAHGTPSINPEDAFLAKHYLHEKARKIAGIRDELNKILNDEEQRIILTYFENENSLLLTSAQLNISLQQLKKEIKKIFIKIKRHPELFEKFLKEKG
ncbi:MAG: hypothetical protein WC568_11215, partial [Candidatus Methanoperedens sp.]